MIAAAHRVKTVRTAAVVDCRQVVVYGAEMRKLNVLFRTALSATGQRIHLLFRHCNITIPRSRLYYSALRCTLRYVSAYIIVGTPTDLKMI